MKRQRFNYTGGNLFQQRAAPSGYANDSPSKNLFELINQYSASMGDKAAGMTQEAISTFLHTYGEKASLTWGQSLELMKQFIGARSDDLSTLAVETNNCLELASEMTATGVDNAEGFVVAFYRQCRRLSGMVTDVESEVTDVNEIVFPQTFNYSIALGPAGETVCIRADFSGPKTVISYIYEDGKNFLLDGYQWLYVANGDVIKMDLDGEYRSSPIQNWLSAPLASQTSYAELSDLITTFTSSDGSVDSSMLLARASNYLSPEVRSFVLKITQKMHKISKVGFVSCLSSYLSSLAFEVDGSGKVFGAKKSTIISSIANIAGFVVSMVVTAVTVILSYFFKGVGIVVSAVLSAVTSIISWKNQVTSINAPELDTMPLHLLSGSVMMDAILLPWDVTEIDQRIQSKLFEYGCAEIAFNGGVLVLYLDGSQIYGQFMLELTPPGKMEGSYITADGSKGWDVNGGSLAWKIKVPLAADAQTANAPEVQGFVPRYSEKGQLSGVDMSLVHIFSMLKFAYCLLCAKWDWDASYITISAFASEKDVPAQSFTPIGITKLRAGTNQPYEDGSYPMGLPGEHTVAAYFNIGVDGLSLKNDAALMKSYLATSSLEDFSGKTYTLTADDVRMGLATQALNCISSFCDMRPMPADFTISTDKVQKCFTSLQDMCDRNGGALTKLMGSLILVPQPAAGSAEDYTRFPGSPEFCREDFNDMPCIPMVSTKSVNKVIAAIAITAGVVAATSLVVKINATKIQKSWNNRICTAEEVARAKLAQGKMTPEEYSASLAKTNKQRKRMGMFFKTNDASFAAQEGAGVVETVMNNVSSVAETAINNTDQLLGAADELGIMPLNSPTRDIGLDIDIADVYATIVPIPPAYPEPTEEPAPSVPSTPDTISS